MLICGTGLMGVFNLRNRTPKPVVALCKPAAQSRAISLQ